MTLPLRSKRRREPDVRNSTARTRDLGTRLPVEQRGTTAGLQRGFSGANLQSPAGVPLFTPEGTNTRSFRSNE